MIPASEGTDGLVKGTVERLVRDTGAASLLGVAHWIRHTTLTWVERNFGYAIAKAYAGHTGNGSDAGVTATYVRATNEVSAALAALTGEPHPLATQDGW